MKNKDELVHAMAEELDLKLSDAKYVVDGFIRILYKAIIEDGEAYIPSIVRILTKKTKDRTVSVVLTGEKKKIVGARKLSAKFNDQLMHKIRYKNPE